MASTTFPAPGGFIVGKNSTTQPNAGNEADRVKLDKRVRWVNRLSATLRADRQLKTEEMKRNFDLYNDKHWSTFGSGKRAGWKLNGVLNYCAWVVNHKSAVLSDNKPKVSYSTPKRTDDWQAEIMGAAFEDFYEEEFVQRKVEDVIKLAGIQKAAWLRLVYDPFKRKGRGGASLKVVPGMAVYLNKDATDVDDCTELLYEYTEPAVDVVARYKHLRGKRLTRSASDDEQDNYGSERTAPATSVTIGAKTSHYAPYEAIEGKVEDEQSARVLMREVWTRPRSTTEVKSLSFTVAGEIETKRKVIELEDGSQEPLQTVVTEGNIVYELPMSTVMLLKHASDLLGGLKILDVQDAVQAVFHRSQAALYPTGRRMIIAGQEVADDGMNPFSSGEWPFIKIDCERDPTQVYGRCDIDRIAALQDCLNRIFSMVFDSAHLMSSPIWRLPINSDVSDEEITNAPGAIIREDDRSLRLGKREPGVELPGYIMPYMQMIISQIRELSGLTEIATGGKFKGQQAAETVSMQQEAAGIGIRQGMRNVEQGIVKLGNQFKGLVTQFYTEQRFVQIKDQAGVERHISFIGSRLSADMRMRAKAGSRLPSSPSARFNYALQLMQTPAMDVPELLRNMEELGLIENASVLLRRLQRERNDPNLQWLIPSLNQPPKGKGKPAKGNGGRSARNTTPSRAVARN
ncbi:MAG: hypothetical protein NVSMB5_20080 [Candidatus Velthaea sp.]